MRYASLGNGRLYLGWDSSCRLMELFWPAVGEKNHLQEAVGNRMIVQSDGRFLELGGRGFLSVGRYVPGMAFYWHLRHESLPLEARVRDCVDPYLPIWSRTVELTGLSRGAARNGLFSLQSFALGENTVGEQGAWDSTAGRLYHFKGRTWIAIEMRAKDAVEIRGAVAKCRDGGVGFSAETHDLRGSAVDHGLIQSAVGVRLDSSGSSRVEYLLSFGEDREEADLNLDLVRTAGAVEARSRRFWQALAPTGAEREHRAATSVKVLSSHCDGGGGVVASCDSDILGDYRDHYRYVWPRDAAMCTSALLRMGYPGYARRYLDFCAKAISPGGFFWQRYRPDGTRGSGWHAWELPSGGLPIQEDETALSLITAGDYLDATGDLAFLHRVYAPFIDRAAEFILEYTTEEGTLVRPSFDLWEERRGAFSFTQAACVGGLAAASRVAGALGFDQKSLRFEAGTRKLMGGLALHLSGEETGFCRGITGNSGGDARCDRDWTDDASLFLIPLLVPGLTPGLTPGPDAGRDDLAASLIRRSAITWKRLQGTLAVRLPGALVPGYARYSGDLYQRTGEARGIPGNPWLVTTAWYALSGQRLGLLGEEDMRRYLDWFDAVALESGVMPEQVDGVTGDPLSVSPLAWSHAMHLEMVAAAAPADVIPRLGAGKDSEEDLGGEPL